MRFLGEVYQQATNEISDEVIPKLQSEESAVD